MTQLTQYIVDQKSKCLKELKRYYTLSLEGTTDNKLLRKRQYLILRAFCLDCSLLTFEEIALMEYEVKNEQ